MVNYTVEERGQLNTLGYRCYVKNADTNEYVSPFHDIPLYANEEKTVLNAVIEIPRWSNAKMEISKSEAMNPIIQDTKKGKLRFVNNVFPHHGYIWNYGGLPQTWEDPNMVDKETGCIGDNDPLDICEIGSAVAERGSVVQVKVLGALGLIDEGEADWKIICINVNDPMASKLNDIEDVETNMPGFLDATRDWFKIYKMPTGKPANNFAADGKFYNRAFALDIINHDYECWVNLAKGGYDSAPEKKKGICMENTCLNETFAGTKRVSNAEAAVFVSACAPFESTPAVVERVPIDTVYYYNRSNL